MSRPTVGQDALEHSVVEGLSRLNRYLPAWIGLAMVGGLLLGRSVPGINDALEAVTVGGISLPIALGLLLMMYPVLAKVRYGELDRVTTDRPLLVSSIVLNWVVGPALMFALAWTRTMWCKRCIWMRRSGSRISPRVTSHRFSCGCG